MPDVAKHGWSHRPRWLGGTDENSPLLFYPCKVFADRGALDGALPDSNIVVSVGDGKFEFPVEMDGDNAQLVRVSAGVSAAGAVTVQIHNATQGVDMLSTPITIEAGEFASFGPDSTATPPVINTANATVVQADRIRIDVDDADGDAEGLTVQLVFLVG